MKKYFFLFVFSSLTIVSYGQRGLFVGVKGGPQSTWMLNSTDSDNPDFSYVNTIRANFGISMGYNFTNGVGLGLDVLYSAQGQKYEVDPLESFRRVNYLKVPILLNLTTYGESTVFGYLNVGPQFGFLLSAKDDTADAFLGLFGASTDWKDAYKPINIGAVLGFGAGFNLTDFLQLTAGLRLDYAFTDAEDKDSPLFELDQTRANTYNTTGALEIGVRYVMGSN